LILLGEEHRSDNSELFLFVTAGCSQVHSLSVSVLIPGTLNRGKAGPTRSCLSVWNQEKGVIMKLRNKHRRSRIVNRSLQYRFLVIILIYGFITVAFLSVYLFVPEIMKLHNESVSFEARTAAADRILTFHSRIWPVAITLICFLGLHSIIFFHRLVGPLYRFRVTFEQVCSGDLSFRVKTRSKDYLNQEEAVLNEMIEMLAGKLGSIQLASLDALKSLGELEQKVSGWTETDKELLRLHRQHLDRLMDTAQYFQLQKGAEGAEHG
jgi:methyl-accepting chemotaxis protein